MKLSVIKVIRKSDGREIGINAGDFNPKKHESLLHLAGLKDIQPSEIPIEKFFPNRFDEISEAFIPEPSEASDVDFAQTTPESVREEPESVKEKPDSVEEEPNDVENLSSFSAGDAKNIIAEVTDLAILNEMEEGEKNGKDRISVANAIDRRREEL